MLSNQQETEHFGSQVEQETYDTAAQLPRAEDASSAPSSRAPSALPQPSHPLLDTGFLLSQARHFHESKVTAGPQPADDPRHWVHQNQGSRTRNPPRRHVPSVSADVSISRSSHDHIARESNSQVMTTRRSINRSSRKCHRIPQDQLEILNMMPWYQKPRTAPLLPEGDLRQLVEQTDQLYRREMAGDESALDGVRITYEQLRYLKKSLSGTRDSLGSVTSVSRIEESSLEKSKSSASDYARRGQPSTPDRSNRSERASSELEGWYSSPEEHFDKPGAAVQHAAAHNEASNHAQSPRSRGSQHPHRNQQSLKLSQNKFQSDKTLTSPSRVQETTLKPYYEARQPSRYDASRPLPMNHHEYFETLDSLTQSSPNSSKILPSTAGPTSWQAPQDRTSLPRGNSRAGVIPKSSGNDSTSRTAPSSTMDSLSSTPDRIVERLPSDDSAASDQVRAPNMATRNSDDEEMTNEQPVYAKVLEPQSSSPSQSDRHSTTLSPAKPRSTLEEQLQSHKSTPVYERVLRGSPSRAAAGIFARVSPASGTSNRQQSAIKSSPLKRRADVISRSVQNNQAEAIDSVENEAANVDEQARDNTMPQTSSARYRMKRKASSPPSEVEQTPSKRQRGISPRVVIEVPSSRMPTPRKPAATSIIESKSKPSQSNELKSSAEPPTPNERPTREVKTSKAKSRSVQAAPTADELVEEVMSLANAAQQKRLKTAHAPPTAAPSTIAPVSTSPPPIAPPTSVPSPPDLSILAPPATAPPKSAYPALVLPSTAPPATAPPAPPSVTPSSTAAKRSFTAARVSWPAQVSKNHIRPIPPSTAPGRQVKPLGNRSLNDQSIASVKPTEKRRKLPWTPLQSPGSRKFIAPITSSPRMIPSTAPVQRNADLPVKETRSISSVGNESKPERSTPISTAVAVVSTSAPAKTITASSAHATKPSFRHVPSPTLMQQTPSQVKLVNHTGALASITAPSSIKQPSVKLATSPSETQPPSVLPDTSAAPPTRTILANQPLPPRPKEPITEQNWYMDDRTPLKDLARHFTQLRKFSKVTTSYVVPNGGGHGMNVVGMREQHKGDVLNWEL